MLTELDFALFAYCAYYKTSAFDNWHDGIDTAGVCFGTSNLSDGSSLLVFEGSHDLSDWFHNFQCVLFDDPELGGVCDGFMTGIRLVLDKITPTLNKDKPIYCVGHSRGGAQAIYIGALLALRGYNIAVFAFEPPRTMHDGGHKLAEILSGKTVKIYRNGEDIVPVMPLEYSHPADVIAIYAAPIYLDIESNFKYHHMQMIITALALREKSL